MVIGPANATSTMPNRNGPSRPKLTGTGFAYPEQKTRDISRIISGRSTVPNGSICLSGLKLIRPARNAVSVAEPQRDEAVRGLVKGHGKN